MRLLHRPGSMKNLGIASLRDQGFDTFQSGAKPDEAGGVDDIWTRMQNEVSAFDDEDPLDIYWALNLEGDSHVFPNGYTWKGMQLETYDRNGFYDSPSHQFYSDVRTIVTDLRDSSRAGTRLKGIRWNHEYRPVVWKLGTDWATYAMEHNPEDFQTVAVHRATEWEYYRRACAPYTNVIDDHKLGSKDAYDGPDWAPWNGSNYVAVKRLYKDLVHFQANCQAKMIGHIATILGTIDSSLRLIVFPPAQGPSDWGLKENTLDLTRNSLAARTNIKWEFTDQDGLGDGHIVNYKAWARQAMDAHDHVEYFFTLKQLISADDFQQRLDRVEKHVANCFFKDEDGNALPGTSDLDRPWNESFGFWSRWLSSNAGNPNISVAQQTEYAQELRDALNEHG